METARVVIIGGGAVGVSSLYHLAKAGWTDCVLLEKNELTAGSTWHAAGNCPTFSTSWAIMNMQRYSTELYRGSGGGGRLSDELPRHGLDPARPYEGADAGIPARLRDGAVSGDGARHPRAARRSGRSYPFIETHDLTGALYDPNDGDIDPAQLTQALAKGARDMGATIVRFRPATGVSREGGEWIVHTEKGDIRCEIRGERRRLLCAAGRRVVPPLRRADGADDGDEPPVPRCSSTIPEVRGLVGRRGPQAAAAARRGRLLLPAAGEVRLQPWPL